MRRLLVLLLALNTLPLVAGDVYVPPVPIGVKTSVRPYVPKGPIPFPDADETWVRIRTPHFDVISSASEAQTDAIAEGLETLGATLTELASANAAPATVFVFAKREESQAYFDLLLARENSNATGVYVRHRDGGTMFIDASRPRRIERTAMHELVHDLLRQSELVPPLWLEEGLAEYFGNAEVQKDRVVVGLPIPEHEALLRKRVPMSADELYAVTIDSDVAATPHFYAQSWAAVSWLMRENAERFWPFLRAVSEGAPVANALATHYGKPIRFNEAPVRAELPNVGATTLQAGSPIDRPTLLFELGRFLSHVAGAEKEMQRHYAEGLRLEPRHARTLAATGQFEAAIAAGPKDAEVHLAYAESLLKTAIGQFAGIFEPEPGDDAAFRKARTLARRALDLRGDEGRARAVVGTSYLVETELGEGIAELERARALLPHRSDVALNLYAMYLRIGDRAKADALFAAAFEHARDKQIAFAARNVLLVSETTRANALAKSGRLAEAAVVVRALAAATTDANAKRELLEQAAQLESVALVNQHIAKYNEAIAYSNAGRTREALRVLEELLKVASDPLVIQDAKRLQSELRKR